MIELSNFTPDPSGDPVAGEERSGWRDGAIAGTRQPSANAACQERGSAPGMQVVRGRGRVHIDTADRLW